MENDKCVIHEKDGSKNILIAVQMTKNKMFPLRIEKCFSSQVDVASPKKLALRSVIEDPSIDITITFVISDIHLFIL